MNLQDKLGAALNWSLSASSLWSRLDIADKLVITCFCASLFGALAGVAIADGGGELKPRIYIIAPYLFREKWHIQRFGIQWPSGKDAGLSFQSIADALVFVRASRWMEKAL